MSDIIGKLRHQAGCLESFDVDAQYMDEAADEIESLRSRLAEAEALLQEVYDGRQSLMSVGLVYRIGHTLNHRPADSATHRETPVT